MILLLKADFISGTAKCLIGMSDDCIVTQIFGNTFWCSALWFCYFSIFLHNFKTFKENQIRYQLFIDIVGAIINSSRSACIA